MALQFHPHEVEVDGYVDERLGISYIGRAVLQEDGSFRCLAAVPAPGGDVLAIVQCRISAQGGIRTPDLPGS